MNKRTLKNGFFSKRLKIKQGIAKIEADILIIFALRLRETFLKVIIGWKAGLAPSYPAGECGLTAPLNYLID